MTDPHAPPPSSSTQPPAPGVMEQFGESLAWLLDWGPLVSHQTHLQELLRFLEKDETIHSSLWGSQWPSFLFRTGILAVTDRRVIIFARKLTGHDFISILHENLVAVDELTYERRDLLVLHALGGDAPFYPGNRGIDRFNRTRVLEALRHIIDETEAKIALAEREAAHGNTETTHGIPAQIRDLAGLRDTGAITPEEFERKKAELLARM